MLPIFFLWCSEKRSLSTLMVLIMMAHHTNSPPSSSMGTACVHQSLSLSCSQSLSSPLPLMHTHWNWCEFPYLSEPVPPFKMLTCLCWGDKWMAFFTVRSTLKLVWGVFHLTILLCCRWREHVVDRYLQIAESKGEQTDTHCGLISRVLACSSV